MKYERLVFLSKVILVIAGIMVIVLIALGLALRNVSLIEILVVSVTVLIAVTFFWAVRKVRP